MCTLRFTRDRRIANLLGALALSVSDQVLDAVQGESDSVSAAAAIIRIGMHPGRSINYLSRALDLSHSATVRLVDRLETDGLVQRQRVAQGATGDRRSVALYLTESGEHRLESILSSRSDRLLPLVETISEGERAQLTVIVEKLIAQLAHQRPLPHICRLCDYESCQSSGCPVQPYLADPANGNAS